ncbi:hypothetical protein NP493_910g00025 [Ridgeia piscesae]|uniref:Uncharacterized protein n=1 Tax=Ridgeia piscesae TaxID=27915 RepID=A0AAD9KKJ3_RIDPI|nr:hypothetical protein NP493_910g00025 [Ridgeia piscesae]
MCENIRASVDFLTRLQALLSALRCVHPPMCARAYASAGAHAGTTTRVRRIAANTTVSCCQHALLEARWFVKAQRAFPCASRICVFFPRLELLGFLAGCEHVFVGGVTFPEYVCAESMRFAYYACAHKHMLTSICGCIRV